LAAHGAVLIIRLPRRPARVSYWLTRCCRGRTDRSSLRPVRFFMTVVRTFGSMFVADAFGDLLRLTCPVMLMLVLPRLSAARTVPRRNFRAMFAARHDGHDPANFSTSSLEPMSLSPHAMALHRELAPRWKRR
jgi:hypothetical protein